MIYYTHNICTMEIQSSSIADAENERNNRNAGAIIFAGENMRVSIRGCADCYCRQHTFGVVIGPGWEGMGRKCECNDETKEVK